MLMFQQPSVQYVSAVGAWQVHPYVERYWIGPL